MIKTKKISAVLMAFIMMLAVVGCGAAQAAQAEPAVAETENVETAAIPEIVQNTPGSEKWQTAIDYSDENNWLSLPENPDKDVDVVYYYPTCYSPAEDSDVVVADITDEGMRAGAQGLLVSQASVFADSCNVFAPYYRQISGDYALTVTDEENAALFRYAASQDAAAALDYYFENLNNGRPFILAGHSQGSETSVFLLADYFKEHPEYLERMVAAYVIGYSVTESFLAENTHLKFAEGADDTGVIVSWNTEGPDNIEQHNAVVLEGAVSINPLNWKTDETYAGVEENLGSLVNGEIVEGVADAQLNLERGTVITTADESYAMASAMAPIFGPECFHGYDYGFYYNNIKANVAERIAAYMAK